MGTWCLRRTLILLFSFRFLSFHIHLSSAVTDFIWIADTVMKTDLNLLNTFKREFVVFLSAGPGGPYGIVVHTFLHDFHRMFPTFFFFCVCQVNVAPAGKSPESNFLEDGEESVFLLQRGADQRGERSKLV